MTQYQSHKSRKEGQHPGLYLMFNAGTEAVDFELPPAPQGTRWHLAVDTAAETPQDWFADGEEPHLGNSQTYPLASHSSAVLVVPSREIHRRETT